MYTAMRATFKTRKKKKIWFLFAIIKLIIGWALFIFAILLSRILHFLFVHSLSVLPLPSVMPNFVLYRAYIFFLAHMTARMSAVEWIRSRVYRRSALLARRTLGKDLKVYRSNSDTVSLSRLISYQRNDRPGKCRLSEVLGSLLLIEQAHIVAAVDLGHPYWSFSHIAIEGGPVRVLVNLNPSLVDECSDCDDHFHLQVPILQLRVDLVQLRKLRFSDGSVARHKK